MIDKLESNLKIAKIIFGSECLAVHNNSVLLTTGEIKFIDFYNGIYSDTDYLIQHFNKSGFQVYVCNAKVWIEDIAMGVKSFHVPDDNQVSTAICCLFEQTFFNR